ncbi:MAG: hypothetical protein GX986_05965 [Firmicutes bacterium]|nr:hypothetical protein [Bacillota bacterium]
MERYAPNGWLEHLELIIPLNERYLTIPRLVLGDVFVKAGLDVCEITSYKVALTEVCRNLIHFSYRHLEPNPLELTFSTTPKKLTIIVSNRGRCFCTERVKTHPTLEQRGCPDNLDLMMVASLVDNLRTGIRFTNGECMAFMVITKYLEGPAL